MRILLLDNFDSFTYTIAHYLEQLDVEVCVENNRDFDLKTLSEYEAVVLSPGPGLPKTAGNLMEVIDKSIELNKPMLGICLGMQAIVAHFGGELYNLPDVKHGQKVGVKILEESLLFQSIPRTIYVGLYHSWAVTQPLPEGLRATAISSEGVLMAVEYKRLPIYAVQFHPESILSEFGLDVFRNFISLVQLKKPLVK